MLPQTAVFTTKAMVSMAVRMVFASVRMVFAIEKMVFASVKMVIAIEKIVSEPKTFVCFLAHGASCLAGDDRSVEALF